MPPSPPRPATNRHRLPSPWVSVVIPVRDATGLPLVLRGLAPADEVIVVTDGPAAGVEAAVRAACPGAVLVRQTRSGLGNALACGVAAGTGDVVVTLNGDGSTDPGEIPRYVDALLDGADVVLGSRYRDGGRDLTGGRFRRRLNLLLVWIVNVLFGVRRTDPGFGYAAFRRHALDRLGLPDPSGRGAAVWGDGPEFAALVTVRTAARGLSVTEVGSVAYPRMRRPSRADRLALRHWLRLLTTEYAHRRRADRTVARHAGGAAGAHAARSAGDTAGGFGSRSGSRARDPRPGGIAADGFGSRSDGSAGGGVIGRAAGGVIGRAPTAPFNIGRPGIGRSRPAGVARLGGTPPARPGSAQGSAQSTPGGEAGGGGAGRAGGEGGEGGPGGAQGGRQAPGEPIWGPPRRRSVPGRDLWLQAEPTPQDRRPGHAARRGGGDAEPRADDRAGWLAGYAARRRADANPRTTDDSRHPAATNPRDAARSRPRGDGTTGEPTGAGGPGEASDPSGRGRSAAGGDPAREVGARRRRLEAFRQRPDLRVINGEGAGSERTRSGRLRPVPRKNLGG